MLEEFGALADAVASTIDMEAGLLAIMGSTGCEPNGDDHNDPAGHGTMDGE